MSQPAMTSMYATPSVAYAGAPSVYAPVAPTAPAMTSMYMAQGAPLAAPMTMTPSMVPAPAQVPVATGNYAAPAAGFNMAPPTSLTQGLPTHAVINAERIAYEKALDAQLQKQSIAVLEEAKIKKQYMEVESKKKVQEFNLQVDEQVKMSQMRIDQEAQTQICGLQEAAITQRTAKEEAAAIATHEYAVKKAKEDMAFKSYNLQKHWFEQETKLTSDYQAAIARGAKAGFN